MEQADSFYHSIGFSTLPQSFWEKSLFVKPRDPKRQLDCHPSAWSFYNGTDVRIKMCTEINMEDYYTIHHELGHIHYFLAYAAQPLVFQDGPNPGAE